MNDPRPNPDHDLDALFALARQHRPDTSRAEYAFETRLTARLREQRQPDARTIWAKVTWRMLPFFAVAVIALGIWRADIATEADDTLAMASIEQTGDTDLFNLSN